MHAFLFFRKQIWTQSKRSMEEQPDIHARLMSKYKRVPEWWYGIILSAFASHDGPLHAPDTCVHSTVSMVVFGIALIEVWHTEFPVWAFFLSLAICTWSFEC